MLQYDFEIIYKPDKSNTNADAISRIPNLEYTLTISVCELDDKQQFLNAQKEASELNELFLAINSGETTNVLKNRKNVIISSDGLLYKVMK